MDVLHVASSWLHELAAVALLGYYASLAFVVLPAVRGTAGRSLGAAIQATERRALPWLLACVVVFFVTGISLLVSDAHFGGIGNLFASTWSTLLAAKHVLVIVMVVVGAVVDLLLVPDMTLAETDAEVARAYARVRRSMLALTLLGALVLLLTAAAQAS